MAGAIRMTVRAPLVGARRGATNGATTRVAPTVSVSTCRSLVSHHQHRALGVAHHVPGVGAEEVGANGVALRPMRAHDDEIGTNAARLFEELLIDTALANSGRHPRRLEPAHLGDDGDCVLGGLPLLDF